MYASVIVFVMCVAPPTDVGARSMALLLGRSLLSIIITWTILQYF